MSEQEFEDRLMDLISEAMENLTGDAVISVLELKIMALKEELEG